MTRFLGVHTLLPLAGVGIDETDPGSSSYEVLWSRYFWFKIRIVGVYVLSR